MKHTAYLILKVTYDLNGEGPDEMEVMLRRLVDRAVGEGMLTGDSSAEVDSYSLDVTGVSQAAEHLDRDQISSFLCDQVESGNLKLEDLLDQTARLALDNTASVRNEFAERMQLDDSDQESSDWIDAEAHTDDYVYEVPFNAQPWFVQATDEQIIALHGIEWRGDEAADVVAEFKGCRTNELQELFDYLPHVTECGFECSVDEDDAMAWLKDNRPGLWARLLCMDNDIDLVEAQEEEIRGMWDWLDQQGNACDCSFASEDEAALDAVNRLALS